MELLKISSIRIFNIYNIYNIHNMSNIDNKINIYNILNIHNIFKNIDVPYFLLFFACSIFVIFYGRYRCVNIKNHKDILENMVIKRLAIDGWSISHLCFFMLIGFLYPNSLVLNMILGSIWELFETYIGYYKPDIIHGWGFCDTDKGIKTWWYGKFSDILVNFIGFILGSHLNKLMFLKNKK